jgi:hypothetical protein
MTASANHALPPLPWGGGCQCGAVRYRLHAPPLTLYACHCSECRRQSASAFGLSLRVRRQDVEFSGEMHHFDRPVASGGVLSGRFCRNCGVRIVHEKVLPGGEPAAEVNIKGGTLDHVALLEPAGHIWTSSRMAGIEIPAGALAFARQPESYGPLIERFAQMLAVRRDSVAMENQGEDA